MFEALQNIDTEKLFIEIYIFYFIMAIIKQLGI